MVPLSSIAPEEQLLPLNDDSFNPLRDGKNLADGHHLPHHKRPLGIITVKKRLKNRQVRRHSSGK